MSIYIPSIDEQADQPYTFEDPVKDNNLGEEFNRNKKTKFIKFYKNKTPTYSICNYSY